MDDPQSKPAAVLRDPNTGRLAKGTANPNPGGVPKWVKEVRDQLKSRCLPLAAAHLERMLDPINGVKDQDRNTAAKIVLEYTVPKPKQAVRVKVSGDKDSPLAGVDMAAVLALAKAQSGGAE